MREQPACPGRTSTLRVPDASASLSPPSRQSRPWSRWPAAVATRTLRTPRRPRRRSPGPRSSRSRSSTPSARPRSTSSPKRVAAWGWGSTDAAIALGVVPVAMPAQSYGGDKEGVLPWNREAIEKAGAEMPTILSESEEPPYEEFIAAKPDVILATYSGITEEQYKKLSAIAPTVAYPDEAWATPWRDVITTTGEVLGKKAEAETRDLRHRRGRGQGRRGAPRVPGQDHRRGQGVPGVLRVHTGRPARRVPRGPRVRASPPASRSSTPRSRRSSTPSATRRPTS